MAMARVCIVQQKFFTMLKPKLLISDATEDRCQAARGEWVLRIATKKKKGKDLKIY
jgi:hypothetical protein